MMRLLFALLLLPALCLANGGIFPATGGWSYGGGQVGVTKYAGYPTTNGTPDSPTGSFAGYGVGGDFLGLREWTADESGTATAVNARTFMNNSGSDYTLLVLYRNGTLIGTADVSSFSSVDWTGYESLTAVSGQNLTFASGDTLLFGLGTDHGPNDNGFAKDDGDTSSTIRYTQASWTATPPSAPTFTTSSQHGVCAVLRYEH